MRKSESREENRKINWGRKISQKQRKRQVSVRETWSGKGRGIHLGTPELG